ncbi:FIG00780345: hypothetical protein [hydrothermal vent metagenome]|uniref:HTH domain of SpoOJ/ParA/ParB/repB family, involved in chromosome partitioning n=1 Tax=hydrothermal vent metagenome TaxID=652676 RepID=A0A3B0Z2R0_9ZZZZ
MSLIRPFAGLRPVPERADDVVAPPYDVLNSVEARQRTDGRPLSFLHISKAEIDLPENTDPYAASVYAKAAENLQKLIDEGVLKRELKPCYYVYRLTMGDHIQTGLVAVASVAEYDVNRIRKHEFTRPAKEDDRVRQIEALNAQTGPVLLAYKSQDDIDRLIAAVTSTPPEYDLTADDGIGHTFWVVDDSAVIDKLTVGFDAMEAIYIADGHHRSAAGSRVAATLNRGADAMSSYFLSVIFPHKQMKILDYNRVVKDLNGMTADELLEKLKSAFEPQPETTAVSPSQPGEFGLYLPGQWYRLTIKPQLVPEDPVARLDVSLLADNLLEPLLGISDPRTDPRIDFVGGIRGLGELEKRVDGGEMAAAFSMFPTSMEQLMAVADANEVMPPKSTWFEPKLADGLISHVLD